MKPVNLFVKHFPLFLDIFYHFIVLSLSVFLFGEFGLFLLFFFMVVWSGDGRYDPSINHIRGSYLSDPPPTTLLLFVQNRLTISKDFLFHITFDCFFFQMFEKFCFLFFSG